MKRQAPTEAPIRSEYAAAQLRKEILNGVVTEGDLLAELAVGKRLGMSRVPVREALFALEREGLVEFSATGRAYVRNLSVSDFEELYTLRLALEPLAGRLAAPFFRCDSTALEANIEATRRAQLLREVTRLDLDFHQLILEASGNKRLLKLWLSLRGEMELWLGRLHRAKQVQTQGTQGETVASHLSLLECFKTGTPTECEQACRRHVLGWREWLPLSRESDSSDMGRK